MKDKKPKVEIIKKGLLLVVPYSFISLLKIKFYKKYKQFTKKDGTTATNAYVLKYD